LTIFGIEFEKSDLFTREKKDFLSGRFLSYLWDEELLSSKKKDIVKKTRIMPNIK